MLIYKYDAIEIYLLYKDKRELTILEITYLVIAVIAFLVAAIIALLNQSLGVALLIIPFIAFLAFSANMIVWALVKMLLDESNREDTKTKETIKSDKHNEKNKTSKK